MQTMLKELYLNLLSNFKSKCGLLVLFKFLQSKHRTRRMHMKRWEGNDQTKLCTCSSNSSWCGSVPFVLQWRCCTPPHYFGAISAFYSKTKTSENNRDSFGGKHQRVKFIGLVFYKFFFNLFLFFSWQDWMF